MSHHKRALDALLSGRDEHTDSLTNSNKPDADRLSALEAIYYLYLEDGIQVIGSPESAFATFNPERGKLSVYTYESKHIDIIPYQSRAILTALECAKMYGAHLSTNGNNAVCIIGDARANGASYGEAALRTLLKYQRLNK